MRAANVNHTSGQSTIEYLLLVTAVVIVVIAVVAKNGVLAVGVNQTLKIPSQLIKGSNLTFNTHPN